MSLIDDFPTSADVETIVETTLLKMDRPVFKSLVSSSTILSSYQWYLNGVALPGDTNRSITVSKAGLYNVIVTDTIGCPSDSTNKGILIKVVDVRCGHDLKKPPTVDRRIVPNRRLARELPVQKRAKLVRVRQFLERSPILAAAAGLRQSVANRRECQWLLCHNNNSVCINASRSTMADRTIRQVRSIDPMFFNQFISKHRLRFARLFRLELGGLLLLFGGNFFEYLGHWMLPTGYPCGLGWTNHEGNLAVAECIVHSPVLNNKVPVTYAAKRRSRAKEGDSVTWVEETEGWPDAAQFYPLECPRAMTPMPYLFLRPMVTDH
jgi:hypothetical protein